MGPPRLPRHSLLTPPPQWAERTHCTNSSELLDARQKPGAVCSVSFVMPGRSLQEQQSLRHID